MQDKKTPARPAATTKPASAETQTTSTTSEPASAGGAKKTSGLAVAALVLVLLGIFIPGLGLVGIILAIVALVQLKKSNEGGKGLAVAALVIAVIEIVLGMIILGAVLFAFNKAVKDSGVNINTQTGSVDVKGKDGESLSIGNAKVPDGFPSDVPIYKPSDVVLSLKTKEGYNVTLATSDSAQSVADFYKSQLPSNGWTAEDTSAVFNTNVAQSYSKGNSQLVLIIGSDQSNKDGKKTTASLTYVTKTNN